MKTIITTSAIQTQKKAKKLAKQCLKLKSKHAIVIGLVGDLGSGKTTFIQGFAKALGIKERVISPTFVILKIYKIKSVGEYKKIKHLIHVDAYRIFKAKEMIDLGWKEMMKNPENIIIVEWADKIKKLLPKKYIQINFKHKEKNKRVIKII